MNTHVNSAIVIPSKEGIQWHVSAFNSNSIPYFTIAQHLKRSRALDSLLRGNDENDES